MGHATYIITIMQSTVISKIVQKHIIYFLWIVMTFFVKSFDSYQIVFIRCSKSHPVILSNAKPQIHIFLLFIISLALNVVLFFSPK